MTTEEKIINEYEEYRKQFWEENKNNPFVQCFSLVDIKTDFLLKKIAELEERLNAISSQKTVYGGSSIHSEYNQNTINQKPTDVISLTNKTPTK